jgi:hypothetical protein
LASPRRRRRLARVGLALVALAVASGIVVWDPGGIDPPKQTPIDRSAPVLERPANKSYALPRVTGEMRREIGATVDRFVATVVVRRDLDAGWRLASPEMREGVSRRQWDRGNLPVVPYPAEAVAAVDWQLGYVDGGAVVVDVMIQPTRSSGERVQIYSAQLSRDDRAGRWLVDSWIPAAALGTIEPPVAPARGRPGAIPPLAFADARLSPWWFLVPAFLLALMVLTPIVLVLRGVRSRRRAERAYREWSAG